MAETPGDVGAVIASSVGSKTVNARSDATLTVIASEAKQSMAPQTNYGLLRRFRLRLLSFGGQVAPRNDGHDFRSPGHRPYGFTFQTARRGQTRLRDLAAALRPSFT